MQWKNYQNIKLASGKIRVIKCGTLVKTRYTEDIGLLLSIEPRQSLSTSAAFVSKIYCNNQIVLINSHKLLYYL